MTLDKELWAPSRSARAPETSARSSEPLDDEFRRALAPAGPRSRSRIYREALKRVADIVLAIAALVVCSPLLLLLALIIRLDSHGPATFKQTRVGRHGKTFRVWKFRTMAHNAERFESNHVQTDARWGFTLKNPDDPRVTRFGRFLRRSSLDELPQFVNVLRGDMSIVGPRPLKPYEVELDGQLTNRLRMRPGITGLWQVSGRHALPADARARLDLAYVHDWSLRLDAGILIRTIPALLNGRGAF